MSVTVASAQEPPGPGRIAEVVGHHTTLRPFGADQLQGKCPFCGSPMLRIRPRHDTFHCFSCGEGGDAQAFVAKIERRGRPLQS